MTVVNNILNNTISVSLDSINNKKEETEINGLDHSFLKRVYKYVDMFIICQFDQT